MRRDVKVAQEDRYHPHLHLQRCSPSRYLHKLACFSLYLTLSYCLSHNLAHSSTKPHPTSPPPRPSYLEIRRHLTRTLRRDPPNPKRSLPSAGHQVRHPSSPSRPSPLDELEGQVSKSTTSHAGSASHHRCTACAYATKTSASPVYRAPSDASNRTAGSTASAARGGRDEGQHRYSFRVRTDGPEVEEVYFIVVPEADGQLQGEHGGIADEYVILRIARVRDGSAR